MEVIEFEEVAGKGVKGIINGEKFNLERISGTFKQEAEKLENEGKTVIGLFKNNELLYIIGISDTVKRSSKKTVSEIKKLGMEIVMLTGDNRRAASKIADELGIEKFYAEVLPQDKINIVKELQNNGRIVAFVGDGINDAPAIKQAQVGIAMGTGSDIAIEAGDIVLVKGNLENVIKAIRLSTATFNKIKQNLFWALFYNIVAIPIAAVGLLHPAIAEIAMAFSSINVVTNSLRLYKTILYKEA